MDLSKPVTYRGLNVNNVTQHMRTLRGFSVESADYSTVEAVGYTEKRAAGDGIYASDVYLGPRLLDLRGLLYANSLPELFDQLRLLRVVFSATSAYTEDPINKGFMPLRYSTPTMDKTSFPGGVIPLYINVRPRMAPKFLITRDRIVGFADKPQAIPWEAYLIARDPRVYIEGPQQFPVYGPTADVGVRVDAINRGDYETAINIVLATGPGTQPAGYFRMLGGGADMRINIEAKPNTIYRWRGEDRILTTQDATNEGAAESLRMDLVSFTGREDHPVMDAEINPLNRPYTTPITFITNLNLAPGSRIFWNEAFA
jgi:hypothetical protein